MILNVEELRGNVAAEGLTSRSVAVVCGGGGEQDGDGDQRAAVEGRGISIW